jgi:hypothetical protein
MSGHEFSLEMKRVFFRVIAFIESEKYGPKIPLNNTLERPQGCLGISIRSISNLRSKKVSYTRKLQIWSSLTLLFLITDIHFVFEN